MRGFFGRICCEKQQKECFIPHRYFVHFCLTMFANGTPFCDGIVSFFHKSHQFASWFFVKTFPRGHYEVFLDAYSVLPLSPPHTPCAPKKWVGLERAERLSGRHRGGGNHHKVFIKPHKIDALVQNFQHAAWSTGSGGDNLGHAKIPMESTDIVVVDSTILRVICSRPYQNYCISRNEMLSQWMFATTTSWYD